MLRKLYNIEFFDKQIEESGPVRDKYPIGLEMLVPSITELMTLKTTEIIENYNSSMGEFEPFVVEILEIIHRHLPNKYESIHIHRKESNPEIKKLESHFIQTLEKRLCYEIKKRFSYDINIKID
jgi:spore germination cell wall hydrolase CwlJ-like protein